MAKVPILFSLEIYLCFTMLCWFLPYITMHQPQVYLCPLPLERPSYLLPPHPILRGCHRASDGAPCVLQQSPAGYLSHMVMCMFNATPSIPLPPYSVSMSLFSVSASLLLPCNRFISTIFLDSIYRHLYTVFVLLFLTYFTLYKRLQVHPPH